LNKKYNVTAFLEINSTQTIFIHSGLMWIKKNTQKLH
jgi:hypothetical protein